MNSYSEKNICSGWEFSKNPFGTEYSDTLDWHKVQIPHDWLIYDTNNLYETSTGWYRRKISSPKTEDTRTAIRFEGIYMDSKIYVNGTLVKEWKYGYSTVEADITDYLTEGENLVAVRVDHKEPNSRWYSGAGIFRKVILKSFPQCHITSDGVYISGDTQGNVTVTAEAVRPEGTAVAGLSVREIIFEGDTEISVSEYPCCACDRSVIPSAVREDGVSYSVNTVTMKIENPILWDIENPHLYRLETQLLKDGEIIHSVTNSFGLRKTEFTFDKGFFLNGRHVKLHGVCEHHDLGCLGAAVNRSAIKRKLEKLRFMGVNSIRTSHNMPAVELMELADEMGFLILSEGFDMWELPKTQYDYARFFPQWVDKDVASWVRRDRNHPSLIGWSIGNEIYDVHAGERGQEITSMLINLVRLHDPRSNGCITQGSNFMAGENGQKCADILKIAGYNYAERLYDEHHAQHPDWVIYGSETSSVVQSRGIYHFPLSQSVLSEEDEQCSALGNSSPIWAAKCTEENIIPDRDREFCAGQYIWTGFDYIGEPTPYSTKNSYFGQFDTAGFPKDSVYLYKGEWTDGEKDPFVHIYPYWDFAEGQEIDVRVASNAAKVELFLNGELIGSKVFDHEHGSDLTLNVKLPYSEGELLAIAYDKQGNEVARDFRRSFGDTAEIRLIPENDTLRAGTDDLIFLEISAYDKDGIHVANANNRVFVNVSGAGRLVGLDNGDSTDYEQYKGISRRLFSGKLLAVIAAKSFGGDINVTVTSPSLPDSKITLKALDFTPVEGFCEVDENSYTAPECPDDKRDIPVRKITFACEDTTFTADCRERTFITEIHPKNAVYGDEIQYKITNATGIKSNIAEIVSNEGGKVTVRCLGDGEFYLRAVCKNGTDRVHLISAVKLKGEGLGAAFFNPYTLIAGGLYNVSGGEVQNGIGQGASFAKGESWFGFKNIDFGKIGSDTISLPIFSNRSTPVQIKVYDGTPEDGELIGDFSYFVPAIWLTYQPLTYKLNKILKGVHTVTLLAYEDFDLEGILFEETPKEIATLFASDCESVYGDKFTVGDGEITGIGNNVTVDFGEFDFSEKSPTAAIITGRSELPINSIHIMFEGETEKRVLAEFEKSEEYTERSFALEGIRGKCRVLLTFLPGTEFDLRALRFELG